MAKHVILEGYTFTPSTRTIVVTGKNIRREQLMLITNVSAGTVLYNFSDPALGFTNWTNSVDATTALETTTIVLTYNTSSMSSSDKLSILVEETYQEIIPAEVMRDPVDKLRVSEPQALTDTDFEYGPQPTKWEALSLLSNRPSAFYDSTVPVGQITGMAVAGKTVTITVSQSSALANAGIANGVPIFVQGTRDVANTDGWWIVDNIPTSTTFTYITSNYPNATIYDPTKTYIFSGTFFTGAGIPTLNVTANGTTTVLVNTANAHSLYVGDTVYVANTTGVQGINGTWSVTSTPTSNTFTYTANTTVSGTVTLPGGGSGSANTVFPRTMGYVEHRPFDGGVQFTNQQPYHGYSVVRQTRRQFRYQSGKGIQFSTGTILKPALMVDSITSAGTTCTITTRFPHGLQPGATIKIIGSTDSAYNGTFTVLTTPSQLIATYTAASTPSVATAPGFPITVSPNTWYGAANRIGMFDGQNGFYFEYDGQTIWCVKRSSTTQISGSVAVTNVSNVVTGTNTKFSTQLVPGDYIVIRGTSYLVQSITSDTQLFISPEYRGTTATNCLVSKTINQRYPQSSWNIDKCDGTGASQFNLDLTKMQMLYADYTWYGAGAIRFGFKNNRGEVVYCHRIPNNNVNTEAYMRSGNLPARYETNTIAPYTYLTSTLSNTATTGATISVADASLWPNTGNVLITAPGNQSANIEYISYTAKSNTALTIGSRAQLGGQPIPVTFTYSETAPTKVELYSPSVASTISHWGSSVIMDGKFDDDKSYVFNAGMLTTLSNQAAGTRYALMSIRLAPSVDNGLAGLIGAREIINRMQLVLRGVDAYTTGAAFRLELILNGRVSSGTYQSVGGSSLAQIAYHGAGTTIAGGESIFGFFTNASGATSQDLTLVRDIGNSILGGGNTLTCPTTAANIYPDGPDVVILAATALGGTNSINARVSWTEAQA